MNFSRNARGVAGVLIAAVIALGAVLAVPPPHPAHAQLTAASLYISGTGGSANAQTVVVPNVLAYSDLRGVPITIIPSILNTGPMTLNANGFGAKIVARMNGALLGGGEFPNPDVGLVTVMYTGAIFVVVSPQDMTPVGTTIEIRGSSAPVGYLVEDGTCVSQTTYPTLFTVIGASFGSCSAGLFALPDSRGTVFAASDNQGSNGSAGRITNAGSGCTATSVPFLCGAQNNTITTSFLPASGLSVPALSVPALSVPALSVPSLSVAGLSVPSLPVAGLSVPALSVPSLSVAGLSVPALSVPSLSVSTTTSNVGIIPLSTGAIVTLQTSGGPTTFITPSNSSGSWTGTTSLSGSGSTGTGSTGTGTTGAGSTGTGSTGTGTTGAGSTGTGTTGAGSTGTGSTGTGSTGTGSTGTGTTGNLGSGTAMPILNPILGGLRAIKY